MRSHVVALVAWAMWVKDVKEHLCSAHFLKRMYKRLYSGGDSKQIGTAFLFSIVTRDGHSYC